MPKKTQQAKMTQQTKTQPPKKTQQPKKSPAAKKTPAAIPPNKSRAAEALASGLENPALKAHWEVAIARFRAARTREIDGWDEQYEALGEIIDGQLYTRGGYTTVRGFLHAELPEEDERSVRQKIRVARSFDPQDEARYGIARLDALLDYLEAVSGGPAPPAKIDLARQKVRVADSNVVVLFADVSRDGLRAAARAARGRAGKVAAKLSPLVKALKGAAARAGAPGVGIRLAGGKVALTAIPREKLQSLCRAVAAADLPAG